MQAIILANNKRITEIIAMADSGQAFFITFVMKSVPCPVAAGHFSLLLCVKVYHGTHLDGTLFITFVDKSVPWYTFDDTLLTTFYVLPNFHFCPLRKAEKGLVTQVNVLSFFFSYIKCNILSR